jgi:hypothetical protein
LTEKLGIRRPYATSSHLVIRKLIQNSMGATYVCMYVSITTGMSVLKV